MDCRRLLTEYRPMRFFARRPAADSAPAPAPLEAEPAQALDAPASLSPVDAAFQEALLACRRQDVFTALQQGADPNQLLWVARRQCWRTPLQHAIFNEDAVLVTTLLEKGANPYLATTTEPHAAVLQAVIIEDKDVIKAMHRYKVDWSRPAPGPFGDPTSACEMVRLRNKPEFADWFAENITSLAPPRRRPRP